MANGAQGRSVNVQFVLFGANLSYLHVLSALNHLSLGKKNSQWIEIWISSCKIVCSNDNLKIELCLRKFRPPQILCETKPSVLFQE
jgi:hypothetical protein